MRIDHPHSSQNVAILILRREWNCGTAEPIPPVLHYGQKPIFTSGVTKEEVRVSVRSSATFSPLSRGLGLKLLRKPIAELSGTPPRQVSAKVPQPLPQLRSISSDAVLRHGLVGFFLSKKHSPANSADILSAAVCLRAPALAQRIQLHLILRRVHSSECVFWRDQAWDLIPTVEETARQYAQSIAR